MVSDVWGKKRKVIRYYNRFAEIYNLLYGYEQELKIREILKVVNVRDSDSILDVGCGTGLLFSHISSARIIVGVDISLGALKVAMGLIRRAGFKNVSLVRADADYLPFKDGIFDKVFAITLLQNLPNPALALNEIMRVSKGTSCIAVTGLKKSFSREDFSEILSMAGIRSFMAECGEEVKCYIAICDRGADPQAKSINTCREIEMCSSVVM